MKDGVTKKDIEKIMDFVFSKNKEGSPLVNSNILYITDNKETLSFRYGALMTGLEGIKTIYGSGIALGISDINYNGRILDELDRKKVLDKLFG